MNIFGIIEIDRRIDILALVAFLISTLISVPTALYQLFLFLSGPNAELLDPESVAIVRFESRPSQAYVSLIAPISIANTSNAREPLIVLRQTAEIVIGDRSIPLTWHDNLEAPIPGKDLTIDPVGLTRPFIVDTKKINSDLVRFTPQPIACEVQEDCNPNMAFISIKEFRRIILDNIKKRGLVHENVDKGVDSIKVKISIEFQNHPTVSRTCSIPLRSYHLKRLRDYNYFEELCRSD